ncbi:MAG: hypothetical protein AB7M12_10585 [Hyphomonadaceae bacterium]
MVSSIQPATYAPLSNAANSNRAPAQPPPSAQRTADAVRVDTGGDAGVRGARAALEGAIGKLDLALGAGREAANVVAQIRDLARSGAGADADAALKSLLQRYSDIIDGAVAGGADMLAGGATQVSVDPDAPPVTVQGYDLRLKDNPGAEDVLRLSAGASLADAGAAARDADASLARLDTALSRLSGAAQKLSAHDGFLASLESAVGADVDVDLDAEGARLLALQVRQGLAGAGGAIANARPAALLELFRE